MKEAVVDRIGTKCYDMAVILKVNISSGRGVSPHRRYLKENELNAS